MIKFLIPLLFAVIKCESNLDGTWTCFDTDPIPPDSGIDDPNGDGNYVCTNCVNMTPAQCLSLKNDLSTRAFSVYSDLVDASEQLDRASDDIDDMKSLFSAFAPCPWSYISEGRSGLTSNGYPSPNSNFAIENREYYINTVLASWTASTNYYFCHVDPMPYATNLGYVQMYSAHNSLVGIWTASHEMAMSTNSQLEYPLQKIESSKSYVTNSIESLRSLQSSIDSITCETCQLGSGGSGGSGSGGEGVDQGCRECYLEFLRSIDSNVDKISDNVEIIKDNVGNYTNELLRILRSIDINVVGISNHVARLDDYITDDFRSSVSNIVGSVLVISQQVDSVQRAYYEAFGRSNDHKDRDDQPYTLASMSEAVFDGPSGFDEGEFMKLDWQARQELLMYRLVNPPETNVVQDIQEQFERNINSSKQTVETSASELQTAVGGFVGTFRTVQSTIDNFASVFGGSVQLPESLTLLSEGSWLGEEPLVVPINPTVAGFSNLLFFSIWYTVAFVVGFRLSVAVWGIVSTVAVSVYKMFGKDD